MTRAPQALLKQVPPHDLQAEQAVLAHAMLNGALLAPADAFYSPAHRDIAQAIEAQHEANLPLEYVAVAERLQSSGKLDSAGGAPYLAEIISLPCAKSQAEYYARIVGQHAQRRAIFTSCLKAAQDALDTNTPIDAIGLDLADNLSPMSPNVSYVSDVSNCRHVGPNVSSMSPDVSNLPYGSIALTFSKWAVEQPGEFSLSQFYNDFDIKREHRKAVQKAAQRLVTAQEIVPLSKRGLYRTKDKSLNFFSLKNLKNQEQKVCLPFGLSKGDMGAQVKLFPGNIIVIAGTTNAGKSAVLLNIAWDNEYWRTHGYGEALLPSRYFTSEMGESELRDRLEGFAAIDEWSGVEFVDRSWNFSDVISRDKINYIDYLEERDGEYFKLASEIRGIHEALGGTGLGVIALQKAPGAEVGRGGWGTAEKARLYISISSISGGRGYQLCSAKIIKCKCAVGDNPNGKEIFFVIRDGATIEPLGRWCWFRSDKERGQALGKIKDTLEKDNA